MNTCVTHLRLGVDNLFADSVLKIYDGMVLILRLVMAGMNTVTQPYLHHFSFVDG